MLRVGQQIAQVAFRTVELSDPAYEHEGLRFVTVKSPALGRRSDCVVWAPSMPSDSSGQEIGTLLILMHGVYGSAWVWAMKAGVHRMAQRMFERGEIGPLVIAMPSDSLQGDGSGYITYADVDVEQWIINEVPGLARLAVPRLRQDARIAIAGLSMGGYGALRLGAKYAERFHAISAHSAITDITQMRSFVEEPLQSFTRTSPLEELSALHWILKHRDKLPPLRFDCGLFDSLLSPNRELHQALLANHLPHVYEEFDGGHEWSYWIEHVAATLRHVA